MTDAKAKTSILWPPDVKNWLIWKHPDAGKDWRWEEKGTTEDEMVGWHHQLDGYEFEQVAGVGDELGSLACCSPRGRKELDTTERLDWTRFVIAFLPRSNLANIFCHPVGCLFTLLIAVFAEQNFFSLLKSHLSIFAFVAHTLDTVVIKMSSRPISWSFSLVTFYEF